MNPPGAMDHNKGEPAPEFQIEFAHRLDHLGPETDPDTLVRLLPYYLLQLFVAGWVYNIIWICSHSHSRSPLALLSLSSQMRGYTFLGLTEPSEEEERDGVGYWGLRIVPKPSL
jgi:hypothetical protein